MNIFDTWHREDALEEWKLYLNEKFKLLTDHIVRHPESYLTSELKDAAENWKHYNLSNKFMIFNRIKQEYAQIFILNHTPLIFTLDEWKNYCFQNDNKYCADWEISEKEISYGLYLQDQNKMCFIYTGLEEFSTLDFYPAIKLFANNMAYDLMMQKVGPLSTILSKSKNNVFLLNNDPAHRLPKALNLLLNYQLRYSFDDDENNQLVSLQHHYIAWFAAKFNLALRLALWRIEANNDPEEIKKLILKKLEKIYFLCEDTIRRHQLDIKISDWQEIVDIADFEPLDTDITRVEKMGTLRDTVAKTCDQIVETLDAYNDESPLPLAERERLRDLCPQNTSVTELMIFLMNVNTQKTAQDF
jgi:hypothetical protein